MDSCENVIGNIIDNANVARCDDPIILSARQTALSQSYLDYNEMPDSVANASVLKE